METISMAARCLPLAAPYAGAADGLSKDEQQHMRGGRDDARVAMETTMRTRRGRRPIDGMRFARKSARDLIQQRRNICVCQFSAGAVERTSVHVAMPRVPSLGTDKQYRDLGMQSGLGSPSSELGLRRRYGARSSGGAVMGKLQRGGDEIAVPSIESARMTRRRSVMLAKGKEGTRDMLEAEGWEGDEDGDDEGKMGPVEGEDTGVNEKGQTKGYYSSSDEEKDDDEDVKPLPEEDLWWQWKPIPEDQKMQSEWNQRVGDVDTMMAAAMAETGQIKLGGIHPTYTEATRARAKKYVLKQERLWKEREDMEAKGTIGYYKEWARRYNPTEEEVKSKSDIDQLFDLLTAQTRWEYLKMGDLRLERDPLVMRLRPDQIEQVWGGDPIYATTNYEQDPNAIMDFTSHKFHEPTPHLNDLFKESRRMLSKEDMDLEKRKWRARSRMGNEEQSKETEQQRLDSALDIGDAEDEDEEDEDEEEEEGGVGDGGVDDLEINSTAGFVDLPKVPASDGPSGPKWLSKKEMMYDGTLDYFETHGYYGDDDDDEFGEGQGKIRRARVGAEDGADVTQF